MDKESIKKALEDNANYKHYNKLGYIDDYKCKTVAYADILTLINELESENELLRNAKVVYETVDYCYEDLKKAQDRIAELEESIEKWQRKAINYYQRAKSYGIECIIDNDIDETLKEYEK